MCNRHTDAERCVDEIAGREGGDRADVQSKNVQGSGVSEGCPLIAQYGPS